MSTLVYADEVVPAADVDGIDGIDEVTVAEVSTSGFYDWQERQQEGPTAARCSRRMTTAPCGSGEVVGFGCSPSSPLPRVAGSLWPTPPTDRRSSLGRVG